MARGFSIHLGSQFGREPRDFAAFIRHGLENLIMANRWAYRQDPKLPSVYAAGVVYRREPRGYEQFLDVTSVLERGHCDCEDASAAVVAWRIERTGELCQPVITWQPKGPNSTLFHITVRRADGSREDPSKLMGMGNEPGEWRARRGLWVYELFPGRTGLVPESVPILPKKDAA